MKKRLILVLFAFAACMSTSFAQLGDEPDTASDTLGDPRVRTILDELQLQYDVVSLGRFRLVLPTEGDRTQLVMINSQTETTGKFEIREVWSPGYSSNGPLPGDVANRLLISSFEQKLGAWQTLADDSTYMAVFAIKLAANADVSALRTAILICVNTADIIEKELTNGDRY